MSIGTPLSDLGGKHRAKPVPSETHRLMRDIDAPFVEQILDVSQRKRKLDIHHNRKADDLGRRFEVAKWVLRPAKMAPNPLSPSFH